MPCSDALITQVYTTTPETSVEDAMHILDEHTLRALPVLDADGKVVGIFDVRDLMIDILPISSSLKNPDMRNMRIKNFEVHLNQIQGSGPWIQKRLKGTITKSVKDIMNTEFRTCNPETPLREAVRLMTLYGTPLPIIDSKTHKMVGIVTMQSALKSLLEIKEIIQKEEQPN